MPLTSGIVAPSTFRIPEESQFLKELRKEEEEETDLVKELREVIDVTQDDYDNKCQECCALEEDKCELEEEITLLKKEIKNLKNNETIREELIVDMKAEIITYLKKENEDMKKELEKDMEQFQDWDNLMDFTSSLTGSPCDPEDIKDYINRINSMVTELKKENDELKADLKGWKNINMDLLESEYMTTKDCENKELKKEIEELKKDIEKQLAAVECLQFMDFTYEDGRWFDADCESEEEEEEEKVPNINCDCCGNVPFDKKFTVVRDNGYIELNCEACYKEGYEEEEDESEEEEDEVCSTCHKQVEGDDKCSTGCPEYDAGCNQEEENNKAFAKNIVKDIIDNALNQVTH